LLQNVIVQSAILLN